MHDIIIRYIKVGATVLCSFALLGVFLYKLATSALGFSVATLDTSDILSILLALFSVGLSIMFYFKSSDESGRFYQNSYEFTKDVSEILGRIEAGFGERLRHLDEGYSGLRERFDRFPLDKGKAAEEIKEEEKTLEKVEAEKNTILKRLAERAKLEEHEKQKLFEQLAQKDAELLRTRDELQFLRRRLDRTQRLSEDDESTPVPQGITRYIAREVVPKLGREVISVGPRTIVRARFAKVKDQLLPDFLEDAEKLGITEDGALTDLGIRVLRNAVRFKGP
jgi:hypothetical protein